jgi:uncharacterized protein (TIGR03437 family)
MRFATLSIFLSIGAGLGAAAPHLDAVVNSASYAPNSASPGSLATIFGSGLAATTSAAAFPPPTYFGNATVYVNGVSSPMLYVSDGQINFQVPWETQLGTATVVMITSGVVSNQLTMQITPTMPGIFAAGILHSASAQHANAQGRAVHAGEYITIFATGLGDVTNRPATGTAASETTLSSLRFSATVKIGAVDAPVAFAGLAPPGPNPRTAGVYEINALVPAGRPSGDMPVVVSAGGVQSNPVNISIAAGTAQSIAKFTELGVDGVVLARAITSQNTCPSISILGASQAMQPRAPATLPFYPILSCEFTVPASAKTIAIEGQTLLMPVTDPSRITVVGDTGCRMDATTSQACFDPKAWPVVALAQNALATNPQLLIHDGDYHYREVECMTTTGCVGSPWGYNWDVWREDLFAPFAALLPAAPWVFTRGNHETCDRAGDGWFRFLDPRPMPASCQTYTDPYSISIGQVQLVELDSGAADDTIVPADPGIVAAYVPQFAKVAQLAGSNAWLLTHRPIWAIRSNANSNIVLQAASQNVLPSGIQVVLSGHTHTFQTFTFSPTRAPQLVIGNSGDSLAANPTVQLVGFVLGNATVTQGTSLAGFGFSTMAPAGGGTWNITAFDSNGTVVDTCTMKSPTITCAK